jgi:hypothetical protein
MVLHGLRLMSVTSDIIGVREFVFTCLLAGLGLIALVLVFVLRLSASGVGAGMATNVVGLILVFIFQIIVSCILFTFGVLASRGDRPAFHSTCMGI